MGLHLGHMMIEPIENTPTQVVEGIARPGTRAVVLVLVQP